MKQPEGSAETWLALALSPSAVRRALVLALVVGAVLVAINHGDAILAGEIDGARMVKIALTPLVPYVVSTISSVAALREHAKRDARPREQERERVP